MNNSKSILKVLIPLLLGVILVCYSISQISISKLVQYFKDADYFWVILGVAFGILSHVSRAYRWLFMVEPLGYKPKFANSFMAVYAAYLINFTIPRAGELARASILTNYENIPFEKGFGTIVAERVADTLMLLIIIGFAFALEFEFIFNFFITKFNLSTIIMGVLILLLLAILLYVFIVRSGSKIALKIKEFIGGLVEGALSIFKMKKKWAFIFHTVFIWVMYLSMFYITTFALSELDQIPLAAVLIGFILASFSIAATNGGIGSFPEAIVIAFALFNITEDPSRAFGWIMWSTQTLVIIILGGFSLVYLPIYNRKRVSI
ncbi:lysylphosphatidylglycerol synthase transmembrane domain-containing protein [Winogradskyella aquimaris]|uniref:Lysylphosphatidylglycerol synthase transmembrane domain-containing protein n=1 Tax=Winogradskyella aquimaris TaxID=864074 RepID=A0ABU5EJ79_9FLAO|nr:lysylphosphatidylglycerol synthase transmembrane domain-containing protein [Winogradskyella aquimaris]MDY2586317.1 lysylphosphatidylglycerol synthase transmembrane domain-containing protein [Winogradskyella aquimaris]